MTGAGGAFAAGFAGAFSSGMLATYLAGSAPNWLWQPPQQNPMTLPSNSAVMLALTGWPLTGHLALIGFLSWEIAVRVMAKTAPRKIVTDLLFIPAPPMPPRASN